MKCPGPYRGRASPPYGSGPVTTGFQYLFTFFNKIYLILSLYNSILVMATFNMQLKLH